MKQPAFYLDSAACSGCKACQVACKDKHDLPVGVSWRRVYEVAGGGWEQRRGGAWVQDVVAYNLSMACNHCDRPICLEVCPAGAIGRRADGIVLIDPDLCIGCRYCEWACPYGAPQYHAAARRMTKCTFCVDELDRGRPPACVAACPMRVLDFGERSDLEARHGPLPDLVPLPDPSHTEPALAVTPHPGAVGRADRDDGLALANREEVGATGQDGLRESSLVVFTLLAQTAVGLVWAALLAWLVAGIEGARGERAGALLLPLVPVGPLMIAAMAASLLHLGSPARAFHALRNLRTSWLSREIVLGAAFLAGWLAAVGSAAAVAVGAAPGGLLVGIIAGLAAVGGGFVYSMGRVYRLRTVPEWDRSATTIGFFLTTTALGSLLGAATLAAFPATLDAGGVAALRLLGGVGAAAVAARLLLELRWARTGALPPGMAEKALLVTGAVVAAMVAASGPAASGFARVALLLALGVVAAAATLGRRRFYARYARVGV